MNSATPRAHRVVVIGGGPGGYEAALAAAQLGADATLIERSGVGGSAVLTDVVPSKSLIATAEAAQAIAEAADLGVRFTVTGDSGRAVRPEVLVNLAAVNERLLRLAKEQSHDMHETLKAAGVRIIAGEGRLDGPKRVIVSTGGAQPKDFDTLDAETVIVAVGAHPRELDSSKPDGERILTWKQLYNLDSVPEHLVVIGSGVTGAEFASAYASLGAKVTLVSSRDRVLPGEDADAADLLEEVFRKRGTTVLSNNRAQSVVRDGDVVKVTLGDGSILEASHCLVAVGSIPNTANLGLEAAGVELTASGHIPVNRVACTSVPGIYAVGDCSNAMPLASVASHQGRTAVFHALGDFAKPLDMRVVTSNIFTSPEIATVGASELDVQNGEVAGVVYKLDLESNARAKMQGVTDGFIKLIAQPESGIVIGGVIVGPKASELILLISFAMEHRHTIDQLARSWSVYPSLAGAIVDAAKGMHTALRAQSAR